MNEPLEPPATGREPFTPFILHSWVQTSSMHAYPIIYFTGSETECEQRRAQSNFPMSLKVCRQDLQPASY